MNYNRHLNHLKAAVFTVSAGAFLAGCAVAVDPSEQIAKDRLAQARSSYSQAKANPIVESYSMKTLLDAEKTLNDAEQVNKKVNSPKSSDSTIGYDSSEKKLLYNDISRLAYMSERKSQTSVALAEGVVTQNEIIKLEKEKAEVQLLKSQIEQKKLQQDLNEKGAALAKARQQLAMASSDAERARILADINAIEAAIALSQAEAKAREAEEAKAELAQLMMEMSELQGQLTDRGIVLTIGDVLFATAKSDLNASAQSSMDKIAEFLQKKQNRNLLVEGHTDSVGNDQYNQGLSEQRASSVKAALVKRGVATERIITIGYGEKFPLAGNTAAADKQKNRRVEAIILNEGVKPESQFRK